MHKPQNKIINNTKCDQMMKHQKKIINDTKCDPNMKHQNTIKDKKDYLSCDTTAKIKELEQSNEILRHEHKKIMSDMDHRLKENEHKCINLQSDYDTLANKYQSLQIESDYTKRSLNENKIISGYDNQIATLKQIGVD